LFDFDSSLHPKCYHLSLVIDEFEDIIYLEEVKNETAKEYFLQGKKFVIITEVLKFSFSSFDKIQEKF
jgi:hypothetical protein